MSFNENKFHSNLELKANQWLSPESHLVMETRESGLISNEFLSRVLWI